MQVVEECHSQFFANTLYRVSVSNNFISLSGRQWREIEAFSIHRCYATL